MLDGCSVGCAKKCMDEAAIADYEYLVVTDLGIEKKMVHDLAEEDLERIARAARKKLHTSAS